MAGVPFEVIEQLSMCDTTAAAREVLVKQKQFEKAKFEVEYLLRSRSHGLSEELFRAWRKAIRSGAMPPATDPPSQAFATYWEAASNLANAESRLERSLEDELSIARAALLESSRTILPDYLVFAADGVHELLTKLLTVTTSRGVALPNRNKQIRGRERHLLLYLQRLCAKNDTFSQFGPTGWGLIDSEIPGLKLAPEPGVAKRESYLERWTAHAAAAALNSDSIIRPELSPRLHPNGRIDGDRFVYTDTGETALLDSVEIAILTRCNGETPAHLLGAEVGVLEELAQRKFIRWEVEVSALDPHAFDGLVLDVSRWRDSPVRTRWLELLQPIANLRSAFARKQEVNSRITLMNEARRRLDDLGAARTSSQRLLYAAGNAIGEECFRDCAFSISQSMTDELTRDVEPWIDLWRDSYAFAANRVAAGLRDLFQTAPVKNGAVPLAAFLHHCDVQQLPLTRHGLIALAHLAFQELKTAFRKLVSEREESAEWRLTIEECRFVRRNFDYPKFDEYTFPSADLQISASSMMHVIRGEYEWVLAELHPPIALLQHGAYWSCPEKAALSRALKSATCGKPNFYCGFFAADFTAHTTVRQMDAIPELTNFVAAHRANPKWHAIPPSETEVFINEQNGDVGLRKRGSHEYLGSFARYWIIPLGFHPFFFDRAPHMPRLRCGKVIVQRRSWTILQDELSGGDFTGISRDLVLAIERLRAQRNLPRYVYIRPTERALRRSGAEGRDKDTKPVFIDLESYLFLEIFHRWLTKAGELEVTEMLPDPDHLLWQEADGRRTFELRTLIVPRE
jgi:hypothetical protein